LTLTWPGSGCGAHAGSGRAERVVTRTRTWPRRAGTGATRTTRTGRAWARGTGARSTLASLLSLSLTRSRVTSGLLALLRPALPAATVALATALATTALATAGLAGARRTGARGTGPRRSRGRAPEVGRRDRRTRRGRGAG
jgi:hypothetical protein